MNSCWFLAIAIIIIVIIACLCIYCLKKSMVKSTTISGFQQVDSGLGYANPTDNYTKPFILSNFISPEHCEMIRNYAVNKLFDSEVIGGKHKNIRNSQQCWIPKNHPLARPMFEAASRMFNIPFENGEDLQVVRYLPGQYYNEHHDSCCDNNKQCLDFAKKSGQRKITILVYLNNDFDGGQTYFKNLNLESKPLPGDAIVFYPLADNSNKCHPLALHAGLPVTRGEKWVANLWFRERKFK